jgi:uncharacterized small protein (DUF1192 family)
MATTTEINPKCLYVMKIKALKAENDALKAENEKLKASKKKKQIMTYAVDENGSTYGERCLPIVHELNAEIKALKAEIECWKQADKKREQSKARKARKPKTETLNLDDANYAFYWAAQNGDVVFWKVPCELMDLEDESGGSRVVEAFQGCRFGEEWGTLSSHGIRTMDLKVLEENE